MDKRVCPKCFEELALGDYFCLNCAELLPVGLVIEGARKRTGVKPLEFVTKEKFTGSFFSVIAKALKFLIPVALAIILVSAVYFKFFGKPPANKLSVSNTGEKRIVKTALDLPEITFGVNGYADLVPTGADFYLEGGSVEKFLKAFTSLNSSTSIQGLPTEISDINNFATGGFCIFSIVSTTGDGKKVRSWGFISRARSKSILGGLLESTKEATWSARLVDEYLVFTNSKALHDEVKSAHSKTLLSLSLSSKFAVAKNSLPARGKAFIFISTDSAYKSLESFKGSPIVSEEYGKLMDILVSKDENSYVLD